ncbi:MAG: pre-peptidase C-terminal domain-containing protein [Mojavia pulchra JT2-VF2]|jgi:hypothetical protein|uniref:Pre-peptidase C-terminal domain-containing protein n=1 Tax=Mojavia pulchra JT2-VF2 TaxID=287848 RepID=A0A951Q3B1_9NOST|nr:pre-peptidase C-terminal domain-containing protein [Mojavia pulchra JT2-VF2]
MLLEKNNKKYRRRLNLAAILSMGGSLLIASYSLPISALEIPVNFGKYRIAKTPDERQPEAVQQGIEQIPAAEPLVAPQRSQPIDSPIPPTVSPTTQPDPTPTPQPSQPANTTPTPTPQPSQPVNTAPTPTPQPSQPVNTAPTPTPQPSQPVNTAPTPTPQPSRPRNTNPTPRPSQPVNTAPTPTPQPSRPRNTNPVPNPARGGSIPRPSRPINTNPTPQPANDGYVSPRQRVRQINTKPRTISNPSVEKLPGYPSETLNYKEINFVDVAFGILDKKDFKSQGRYFHFYQFEGRENQLIQIRLGGSTDSRRSNNLSLSPFMFLLDPNNNVLVKRGGSGASAIKDAFIFVRLPVKGKYTIAVTSRNPGDTGRYSLALRNDRASYNLDESAQLSGQSLTLKKNKSPYDVSKFEGKKDQLVSIRVDSLFEEFSPYLVLLNSQGQIIATDNAKDGKYSALIDRAKLPGDGTYYVVVVSASPQERGRYRLTVY